MFCVASHVSVRATSSATYCMDDNNDFGVYVMKKILMATVAMSMLAGSNVWAACGVVGSGPEDCDTTVNLTVDTLAIITGVPAAITLARTAPAADTADNSGDADQVICIGSNSGAANISASSSTGGAGAFELNTVGPVGPTPITYSVDIDSVTLTNTGQAADNVETLACGSQSSAIAVSASGLNTAVAGSYTDTLTLTVSPI